MRVDLSWNWQHAHNIEGMCKRRVYTRVITKSACKIAYPSRVIGVGNIKFTALVWHGD